MSTLSSRNDRISPGADTPELDYQHVGGGISEKGVIRCKLKARAWLKNFDVMQQMAPGKTNGMPRPHRKKNHHKLRSGIRDGN